MSGCGLSTLIKVLIKKSLIDGHIWTYGERGDPGGRAHGEGQRAKDPKADRFFVFCDQRKPQICLVALRKSVYNWRFCVELHTK